MNKQLHPQRLARLRTIEELSTEGRDALLAHIDAQADQLWPIVATRNAALNRAEAAEQAIQRVWNIVGGFTEEECSGANECCAEPLASRVRRALDGGQE